MGFAALWILVNHEWLPMIDNYYLGRIERFVKEMGFYGVDFFLLLSGMGLVYAIGKYSLTEFYKRRFVRVLVPAVITLGLIAIDQGWSSVFFLKVLTGYQFWTVNIYTALWFAFAIMVLYLLFPLYYWIFRKMKRPALFTAVVLLVWLAASNLLSGTLRYDMYGFTNRIPIFLTGVLIGRKIQEGWRLVFSWFHWGLCLLVLMVGVVLYYLVYRGMYLLVPSSECFFPNYLIALSGSCLLASLFDLLDRVKPGKDLLRGMRFFGSLSLELYCIQEIMLKKLMVAMAERVPDLVVNLVNFWVITLAAYLLNRLTQPVYRMLKYR